LARQETIDVQSWLLLHSVLEVLAYDDSCAWACFALIAGSSQGVHLTVCASLILQGLA